MTTRTAAIVGAGMAGLACARGLSQRGFAVTVFDKGRSAGGRIATRRLSLPGGLAQFDHGAQFLTVREAEFREALAPLIKKGALQSWSNAGQQDAEAWVGAPGMSALAKALGSGLDVRTSTRITELDRQKAFWRLRGENNATFGPFDWVIVATPAEQAESLFAPVSGMLATEARSASTEPCWAGLFALSCEQAPTPAAIQLHDHAILDWVACDTIKPQRPSAYSCWVAHATPNWSREHLDDSPESVADKLEQAAWAVLAFSARPIVRQAHRWRYARVERPASTPFACDQRARIGACGDWRIGPCIESAWISGDALSRAIAA